MIAEIIKFEEIKNIAKERYLSKREVLKYDSLAENKKIDWLTGRYAIKTAIARYCLENHKKTVSLNEIEIISKKLTPPSFKIKNISAKKIKEKISVSHTDSVGVGAISFANNIGVDLEKVRKFKPEFIKAYLTKKELVSLAKFKKYQYNRVLTLTWSFKEAYLKAIGRGLLTHPNQIEIELSKNLRSCQILHGDKKINAKAKALFLANEYMLTKVSLIK